MIEMNTRSRVRADREVRRTIEKQRRIERRQRLASRESIGTPYNLRTTMGRRGMNSTRATPKGYRGEKPFDVSAVAPVVLFPVPEEENLVDKGGSEVMFICIQSYIYSIAIYRLKLVFDIETDFDLASAFGTGHDPDTTSTWCSLDCIYIR